MVVPRNYIARNVRIGQFATDSRDESNCVKARMDCQGNQASSICVRQSTMLGVIALDDRCQPLFLADSAKCKQPIGQRKVCK